MIRILIVAKHAEVREGLSTVLQLACGIEIIGAAASLSSALEQGGAECPDVVLVDLEMPDGEGYETIRQVKRLCPCTQTLALTAHDYPATWQRATQAGAAHVIVKGLDWQDMVRAILNLS